MAVLSPTFETPMGRVDATLTVTNYADRVRAAAGEIGTTDVRSVTLRDVLVDTGATLLCLPADVIARLGLLERETVYISTAKSIEEARLFGGVELDVQGRRATVDVLELPEGRPALLGVIPVEALGIEPDLQSRRLRLLPQGPAGTYVTVL